MVLNILLFLLTLFTRRILATTGIVNAVYGGNQTLYDIDQVILEQYAQDYSNEYFLASLLGVEHACSSNTGTIDAVSFYTYLAKY